MRVLITTGGTIGSETAGKVRRLKAGADFGGFDRKTAPFTIFSENMTYAHIARLYEEIRREAEDAEGIVVTHGTDTLPFTAAALAFTLADIRIPVVLVSASAPAGEPGSNAAANMEAAVRFLDAGIPGVYAAYANPGETPAVLFGARMLEARAFDGNYYAPLDRVCARVAKEIRILERPAPGRAVPPRFGHIVPVSYHTGLCYGDYTALRPDAFLLNASHSGTVPTEMANRFIRDAQAPVYLAGGTAAVRYESACALEGVRFLDGIAYPAAFMKLALAYGNFGADAEKYLFEPTANEYFCPRP